MDSSLTAGSRAAFTPRTKSAYCRNSLHHRAGVSGHRCAAPQSRSRPQRLASESCRVHASASNTRVGSLDASGLRIGVVVARFNELVTKLLLEGALDAFSRHGGATSEVVWVPGSFEIPLLAKAMAKSGKFDAVLTIGAVVRGATTHYEAVVNSATSGSLSAGMETGVPVVFGVLTTETMEQLNPAIFLLGSPALHLWKWGKPLDAALVSGQCKALDRAGGKSGNKGFECAVTAIEVANLLKSLRQDSLAAAPWGTDL